MARKGCTRVKGKLCRCPNRSGKKVFRRCPKGSGGGKARGRKGAKTRRYGAKTRRFSRTMPY